MAPAKPEVRYACVIFPGESGLLSCDLDPDFHRFWSCPPAGSGSQTAQIVGSETFTGLLPSRSSPSSSCHTVRGDDVKKDGEQDPVGQNPRSGSYLPTADELKNFNLFLKPQIPVSFSDISAAQSSISPLTAEVSSPKHGSGSGPSRRPSTITHSDVPPGGFSPTLSPFLPPLVDFSYCCVECDPYISAV